MFSVNNFSENGFDTWLLDNGQGVKASILPGCGGILNAFSIWNNGKGLSIIDGYQSQAEFDTAAEARGFKSCKLSPYVCRLKNGMYTFADKDYKVDGFYLGKHALHALIYKANFDVVQAHATADEAELEILYSYKKEDTGYPFSYDCRVLYELKKDNTLHIRSFIKNQSDLAIPVCDGWHPYFSFGGEVDHLLMYIKSTQMLEFDDELIPTGKKLPHTHFQSLEPIGTLQLDNSFLIDGDFSTPSLLLQDQHKKLQLEILCDKTYPVLQLYIPDHRNSIAIENLSAAPDAFNNGIGLTTLQAGKEISFSTSYTIRNID
jgi:aldose 1-epimerase